MTIYLNPNSISGVSSVTAAASPDPTAAVKFYNSQGTETLGNPIVSNLTASSINGGQLAGMRNRIINGDMRISQRGTTFASLTTGTYTLDRWAYDTSGVCTVSQSTDVPNNTFQNSLKVDVTTADTSISAGDISLLVQRIEGFNVRDLIGTTFTLSFWVKSPKTGIHCVAFRNAGVSDIPDRSYIKEYSIFTANTWEYKTITVTGGLITAGTWNWTNGVGLRVVWGLSVGSTYQTTANVWQTGDFFATANQVNVMDNVANDFFLTGVQLEAGSVATPFECRFYGQELALCKRYAQWVPFNQQFFSNAVGGGETHESTMTWPVEMRTKPNAAALTADPNTTQFVLNNSFNAISRLTPYGGSAVLSSSGQGSSYVVGYRSFLSAEL